MPTVEETLMRLDRSKFRSSFYLTKKERAYYEEKGEDKIRSHTADFIKTKLAPAEPLNDGKQTPMHGHPAFKAMHACACCCRGCLEKWYHIPRGRELTENEQERIVKLLSAWIDREMKKER